MGVHLSGKTDTCSEFRGGCTRGKHRRIELHSLCHVAANLHFSIHKSILGLQFALEKLYKVVVEHDKSRVGLALLAEDDFAVAVLQIDSDDLRFVSLCLTHLKVIHCTDFCDDCGTMSLELRLDLLEDFQALHIGLFERKTKNNYTHHKYI